MTLFALDTNEQRERYAASPVQVKAKKVGTRQLDASRYADTTIEGDRQHVNGPRPSPIAGLVYVFVHLEQYGDDRFYVIDWTSLALLVTTNHEAYLGHHGGVRFVGMRGR